MIEDKKLIFQNDEIKIEKDSKGITITVFSNYGSYYDTTTIINKEELETFLDKLIWG